jgi:hypothetical protein
MSDKDLNNYLKKLDSFNKKVSSSKTASRKFLRDMGVLTKSGKVSKSYQSLSTQPSQGKPSVIL